MDTIEHTFVADIEIVGELTACVATRSIKDEPCLSNSDWAFARVQGGSLTQAVLDQLEPQRPLLAAIQQQGLHLCIDTESQFMLPGQYPAIPGWHCDSSTELSRQNENELFFVSSISDQKDGVSQTLFSNGAVTMLVDRDHLWQSVHQQAERLILNRQIIPDGNIVRFSMNTLHCPTACYQAGWRFWFRLAVTIKKPQNKLLRQIQIYSPIESRG